VVFHRSIVPQPSAGNSILESRRAGLELELLGVVAHDADITLGKAILRLGLGLQRHRHLGAGRALQLQRDSVEDGLDDLIGRTMSISTEP
jgi:hypothetical protein